MNLAATMWLKSSFFHLIMYINVYSANYLVYLLVQNTNVQDFRTLFSIFELFTAQTKKKGEEIW